jgi:putative acetyltransferase
MRIRRFRVGDESALLRVHFTAIHGLASRDYTPEQTEAWAPEALDSELWAR